MAGKPGKSGGARPGAGRKPRPVPEQPEISGSADTKDAQTYLADVMNNQLADPRLRMEAAKALLAFEKRTSEAGKKEERAQAAKKAGGGKFAAAAPPLRLVK